MEDIEMYCAVEGTDIVLPFNSPAFDELISGSDNMLTWEDLLEYYKITTGKDYNAQS